MTWPPSILSVLVWTPALGAVVSAFLVEGRLRRRIAIGFAGVSLVLAAAIAIPFDSGSPPREIIRWVPSLGLSYDLFLDGFGSLLVLWIALLTFLALVSSDASESPNRESGSRLGNGASRCRDGRRRRFVPVVLRRGASGRGLPSRPRRGDEDVSRVSDRGGRTRCRFDRRLVPPGPGADWIPIGRDRAFLVARDLSRLTGADAPPGRRGGRSRRSTLPVRLVGTSPGNWGRGPARATRRVEPRGHSILRADGSPGLFRGERQRVPYGARGAFSPLRRFCLASFALGAPRGVPGAGRSRSLSPTHRKESPRVERGCCSSPSLCPRSRSGPRTPRMRAVRRSRAASRSRSFFPRRGSSSGSTGMMRALLPRSPGSVSF